MSDASVSLAEIQAAIRNVPDFPEPGIQFKDITPVIGNARLFTGVIDHICSRHATSKIDHVAGIDARGFIFGAPAARQLGAGFVPIRKKGKLPWQTYQEDYSLEYGTNTIEIHEDAFKPGEKVLLIDDLLATGGTAAAARNLIAKTKAELVEIVFVIELEFLEGRLKFGNTPIRSLISY